LLEKTNNKLLEKTNNNEPLNRFNKKCQVNINYGRDVLLPGAINKPPKTRGVINEKTISIRVSVLMNYCPIFYGSSGNWVGTEDM